MVESLARQAAVEVGAQLAEARAAEEEAAQKAAAEQEAAEWIQEAALGSEVAVIVEEAMAKHAAHVAARRATVMDLLEVGVAAEVAVVPPLLAAVLRAQTLSAVWVSGVARRNLAVHASRTCSRCELW